MGEDERKSKEDMIAYIWIILGVAAGAFSLFAVPHGFRLLDQQKKASAVSGISIHGDFVSGNKTVIGNQVNVNTSVPTQSDNRSKIDVAKLKIKRAFEDFYKAIDETAANFPKESNKLAGNFNSRNMLTSGVFIRAQMDLSLNTKKYLDQRIEALNRQVEDILVDVLGKTSLHLAGIEFEAEQKLLDEAPKRCQALYLLLNDNPKSWEMKALRENTLTKDFDVANSSKH